MEGVQVYLWNLDENIIPKEAIETADYIIHLAGENIGDKRWTAKRKKLIVESRVKSSLLIYNKVKEYNKNIVVFIAASAIGYYGIKTTEKIFYEEDSPANDFLGNTCTQWEQSSIKFKQLNIRTVILRTGVVLAKNKGALSKMIIPVRMGVGSAMGTGNQYIPWIHIDDLCNLYIKAIKDPKMEGVFNAVAPSHPTNKVFMRTLARVLKKPFWFPNVPAYAMKLIFGKMSEMLLNGSRVSADKILSSGFTFRFPNLESALTNLLEK